MTSDSRQALLSEVADYYTGKLAEHGESPRGVDWNGEEGQVLRFEQLCKVIATDGPFSLNDLGCGYGALCDFLVPRYKAFEYTGIDVSDAMVRAAEQRHQGKPNARFVVASEADRVADYSVASGIFNVRMGRSDSEWQAYAQAMLEALDRASAKGFAFNCLTSYSDKDRMRADLYYADPLALFDLCKRRYSRNVALVHDYGLYEFTMIVRKTT
jgi:SAM-dependent methyltransferase